MKFLKEKSRKSKRNGGLMDKRKRITFDERGFRDVRWCWTANEPFIIEYDGDNAVCSFCNWHSSFSKDRKLEESFVRFHPFICHICKPLDWRLVEN